MSGQAFSWWNIVPTLVGGGISLFASLAMFALAQRQERKKRDAERKRLAASDAYVGLQKLMKTVNSIENLARHIDDQFSSASKSPGELLEPAAIMQPILGAQIVVDDLTAQETMFLSKSDGELLAQIWEIQQRARNNDHIAQEYSKYRLEYDAFLESKPHGIKAIDGTILSMELEGDDAKVANMKLGRLNQVIVSLIEAVEKDRKTVVEVVNRYIVEARKAFGDDFPVKSMELRKRKSNANP